MVTAMHRLSSELPPAATRRPVMMYMPHIDPPIKIAIRPYKNVPLPDGLANDMPANSTTPTAAMPIPTRSRQLLPVITATESGPKNSIDTAMPISILLMAT